MNTKHCPKCDRTLPVTKFRVSKKKKARGNEDIWEMRCRDCYNARTRELHKIRIKNDPEYVARRRENYRRLNKRRAETRKYNFYRRVEAAAQRTLITMKRPEYLEFLMQEKEKIGLGHTNDKTLATLDRILQDPDYAPAKSKLSQETRAALKARNNKGR